MEITTKETLEEIDNARDIENFKRIEAALFVAGRFLSTQELVALTDLNPILLNQTLSKLLEKYDETSAIEVVNKGDLWKMDVRTEFNDIVNRLATGSQEFTKAEQETLAIIAYKQPITQSKIISIRGNKAYDHIKRFIELELINSKRKGRTYELNLSNEFYNYFNVTKGKIDKKDFEKSENQKSDNSDEKQESIQEESDNGVS